MTVVEAASSELALSDLMNRVVAVQNMDSTAKPPGLESQFCPLVALDI